LWNVRHNDQNSVEGFLRGYRDFVISTLDHGGAPCPELSNHSGLGGVPFT